MTFLQSGKNRMHQRSKLLPYIAMLTVFFIIIQFGILMNSERDYLMVACVFQKHFVLSNVVWKACIFYGVAQLILYTLFVLSVWSVSRLAAIFLKLSWGKTCRLGFVLWGVSVLAVLLANQVFFPSSFFSEFLSVIFSDLIAWLLLSFCLFIWLLFIILACIQLTRILLQYRRSFLICSLCCVVLMTAFAVEKRTQSVNISVMHNQYPNVIIIGIDALRPDYVGLYNHKKDFTPALNHFLRQAINFKTSLTPLARTFPAWVSILTGKYPKHNGVRFNLVDQSHLDFKNSLANILKKHGYHTIYATDGRRFSDIRKRFGFNELIGVKAGVNDFLLGTLNDFPLSNLIVNTRLGQFLFPYSYANREAFATYEPQTFVNLMADRLEDIKDRPVFLSIHFTLPHWPFLWASMHHSKNLTNKIAYKKTVVAVDLQFKSFLTVLKSKHLLDHAIVVLLSDHGEAFSEMGDRLIQPKKYIKGHLSDKNVLKELQALRVDDQDFSASASHGTDILSFVQLHNVLAIREYGLKNTVQKNVNDMVSLIDIKPTILDLINLPFSDVDGVSLKQYLQDRSIQKTQPRMFFSETGFTPTAIRSTKVSLKETIIEGADMFQVVPETGHIILKPAMARFLLKLKQRAVYYGHWVLALYPIQKNRLLLILVNRKTGQWTDDLTTAFAKKSPAQKMLAALKAYYQSEINL